MRRGPETGRGGKADPRPFAEKSAEAWDGAAPDWVAALATLADRGGLKAAAEAIGYSTGLVSQVLANKYGRKGGDIAKVEAKTRGALLGATVDCPGAGDVMDRKTCLDWQDKPRSAASGYRVRMYHACRACPISKHFQAKEDGHGG